MLKSLQNLTENAFDFILQSNKHNDHHLRRQKDIARYTKYPLHCLAMLAKALRSELAQFLDVNFVSTIFNLGLSRSVLRCVSSLYLNVVQYQPLIQDRLSRMTLMVLLYNADGQRRLQINGGNGAGTGGGGGGTSGGVGSGGLNGDHHQNGGDDDLNGDEYHYRHHHDEESFNEMNAAMLSDHGRADALSLHEPLGVIHDDQMFGDGVEGHHAEDHNEQNMMYYHYKNRYVW